MPAKSHKMTVIGKSVSCYESMLKINFFKMNNVLNGIIILIDDFMQIEYRTTILTSHI